MKLLTSIVSIFVIVLAFGQQAKVHLSISPSTAEIGQVFSITITSNVTGRLVFDKVPDEFIQDYNISQGTTQEIDYNSGSINTIYYYTITGVITKEGSYEFGPAYISKGSKSYPSNIAKIKITPRIKMNSGEVTAQQLSDPAFGIIQTNKTEIYEGEPLLVSAKIYSKFNWSHVGTYHSYTVPGATIKHQIGNSNSDWDKTVETFKGNEYLTFSYDKNIIFPTGIGQFQIEPFKMNLHQGYQNFPIVSNPYAVTVKPLPANPPSDFISAVGEFSVSRKVDDTSIKQGDVIKMTVTVAGLGNLQNISEPVLNLPKGFVIYGDPVIDEDNYSIGVHGAEGEISFEYNIEVRKSGNVTLPATSISYFDPEQEKYITVSTDKQDLKVTQVKNFITKSDETGDDVRSEELVVHHSSIRRDPDQTGQNSIYGSPLFWGGISIPILSSIFYLFLARRKEKTEESSEQKKRIAELYTSFKSELDMAKSLSTVTSKEYYMHTESALRKAVELDMNFHEDRVLNKSEIYSYLENQYSQNLKNEAARIFEICEQSRFGFAPVENAGPQLIQNLESLISQLKNVK